MREVRCPECGEYVEVEADEGEATCGACDNEFDYYEWDVEEG